MVDDKILLGQFKSGSRQALCEIYQKYKNDLLKLAAILLHDLGDAEDTVHDVFVTFAQSPEKIKLNGSLKSYLSVCVANRARNQNRTNRQRVTNRLEESQTVIPDTQTPEQWIIAGEELKRFRELLAQLPDEQREVVVLHLRADLTFKQIAELQGVSVSTVQGRYRYGLDKLRSLLNSEALQ